MLEETGTVVKIDDDALWVETVQKSACNSCSAQKGCGQRALGNALSNSSVIRVLLNGQSPGAFQVDQQVIIGIPEDVVVKWSLLIYLLPVVLMIMFAVTGNTLIASDGFSAMLGIIGLLVGGLIVGWYSRKTLKDPRLQPVLLES